MPLSEENKEAFDVADQALQAQRVPIHVLHPDDPGAEVRSNSPTVGTRTPSSKPEDVLRSRSGDNLNSSDDGMLALAAQPASSEEEMKKMNAGLRRCEYKRRIEMQDEEYERRIAALPGSLLNAPMREHLFCPRTSSNEKEAVLMLAERLASSVEMRRQCVGGIDKAGFEAAKCLLQKKFMFIREKFIREKARSYAYASGPPEGWGRTMERRSSPSFASADFSLSVPWGAWGTSHIWDDFDTALASGDCEAWFGGDAKGEGEANLTGQDGHVGSGESVAGPVRPSPGSPCFDHRGINVDDLHEILKY
jgi:hypothetical protein